VITNRFAIVLSGIVSLAAMSLGGCVPSPTSEGDTFPKFSFLSTFYTPQDSGTTYIWQDSSALTHITNRSTRRFRGSTPVTFASPYSIASQFTMMDSASGMASDLSVVITDSLVIEYVPMNSTINAVTRLKGLLSVGSRWESCDRFVTSNGATIVINAFVDNYYSSTSAGGQNYTDVYHVTYTVSDVTSATQPVEPEYQKGATLGIYYAKLIGPTYVLAKDPTDQTLWVSQLIETRSR
jgi:hypothetical protein